MQRSLATIVKFASLVNERVTQRRYLCLCLFPIIPNILRLSHPFALEIKLVGDI